MGFEKLKLLPIVALITIATSGCGALVSTSSRKPAPTSPPWAKRLAVETCRELRLGYPWGVAVINAELETWKMDNIMDPGNHAELKQQAKENGTYKSTLKEAVLQQCPQLFSS
jgi:hypothetical protein